MNSKKITKLYTIGTAITMDNGRLKAVMVDYILDPKLQIIRVYDFDNNPVQSTHNQLIQIKAEINAKPEHCRSKFDWDGEMIVSKQTIIKAQIEPPKLMEDYSAL